MAGLLALALSTAAGPATAYSTLGCKFAGTNLRWKAAITDGTYLTPAQSAAVAWDATATPISLTQVTNLDNIRVADGNYGNVGFDGITLDTSQRNPVIYSCGGGTWDTTIVTWWNRYYTDSYSAAKRQSVMVHEIGHALGLAHWSDTSCSSVTIMQPDTYTRYDVCGKTTPQSDDVAGVNFIY